MQVEDGKMEIFLVNKEATTIDGAIYICIEVLLLSVYVPGSLDTGRVVAFMRFAWFVHLPGGLHHMQGRDVTGIHVRTTKLPIELGCPHPICSPVRITKIPSRCMPHSKMAAILCEALWKLENRGGVNNSCAMAILLLL
jgi:hypothetical protein